MATKTKRLPGDSGDDAKQPGAALPPIENIIRQLSSQFFEESRRDE